MQKIIFEKEVFLNLVSTYNRQVNEISIFIESFGITINQFDVLDIIRQAGNGGLSLSNLGKKLRTRKPDSTRIVDRLESSGLVIRERDTKDRRVVFVNLTKKGSELMEEIYPLLNEIHKNQFSSFSRDELEAFNKLLIKDKDNSITRNEVNK